MSRAHFVQSPTSEWSRLLMTLSQSLTHILSLLDTPWSSSDVTLRTYSRSAKRSWPLWFDSSSPQDGGSTASFSQQGITSESTLDEPLDKRSHMHISM